MDFVRYARRVVGEVLSVARAGSLVLWDGAGSAWVSLWKAEQIIDWAAERVGERSAQLLARLGVLAVVGTVTPVEDKALFHNSGSESVLIRRPHVSEWWASFRGFCRILADIYIRRQFTDSFTDSGLSDSSNSLNFNN
jgi:hypothetical protein